MSKCLYSDLVLVIVYSFQGECTWYQVERALGLRGLGGTIDSTVIAKDLINKGLLFETHKPETNLSHYSITKEGGERVIDLIGKYGEQVFEPRKQKHSDFRL